ncbi:single-stranded DNA-binding protein [Lachnospiraceae bacterium 47-T17]
MKKRKYTGNNKVTISGVINVEPISASDFGYNDHCLVYVIVERKSGIADRVPVIAPNANFIRGQNYAGLSVHATGLFCSRRRNIDNKTRLLLYVYVKNIEVSVDIADKNRNSCFLRCFVCQKPIYRGTPLGYRITDLLVAVNHGYKQSEYIPVICWGDDAKTASEFAVGTKLEIFGRVQSREYTKKLSDTETERRIAYELSVNRMTVL